MRGMRPEQLLQTLASFAGLPVAHLPSLPRDIRAACEARTSGGSGRRELTAVDTRELTHTHRALPPLVTEQLQNAFRPFNELLRTLLNDIAPTLQHGVAWM